MQDCVKALILEVLSGKMHSDGYKFYLCSESKVWLTEGVPVEYIGFPTAE
jgi:RNA:NAD 2'-phosphotransferase (TPT1/KptA family)